MDIKILGEHLPVTEAISQYIKDKLLHLSAPDKINHVEFRIGKEGEKQYVKFYATCPNHETIFLHSSDNDLYPAIDKLMDKIRRSFIKNKEKNNIHLHKVH